MPMGGTKVSHGTAVPSVATMRISASRSKIGDEQVVGLGVLLNSYLVGEEMSKQIVHGERLDLDSDERVVFGTHAGEKIRGELVVV